MEVSSQLQTPAVLSFGKQKRGDKNRLAHEQVHK